jgi:hypothetical protein
MTGMHTLAAGGSSVNYDAIFIPLGILIVVAVTLAGVPLATSWTRSC